MKNALLVYPHNEKNVFNIGDYIQSIAARQFLPTVDVLLNREELNSPIQENVRLILNGWFMHNPRNWPPSNKISPLFIAFHMNKLAENEMLSNEGIQYLKKHEPIGCRDYYTVSRLQSKGIDAYFSGCLTLTLSQTYKHIPITNAPIYITDLNPTSCRNVKFIINCLSVSIFKRSILKQIKKQMAECGVKKAMKTIVALYVTYRNVISDEVLVNAIYREHEIVDRFSSDNEKFQYADRLLREYANAKFVITSRIHCALPCLSMGTPVAFITNELLGQIHNCRLDGLVQLFHTIDITEKGIISNIPKIKKIRLDSFFSNKTDYRLLAGQIETICKSFIREEKDS